MSGRISGVLYQSSRAILPVFGKIIFPFRIIPIAVPNTGIDLDIPADFV
jgi:hypothetical protein